MHPNAHKFQERRERTDDVIGGDDHNKVGVHEMQNIVDAYMDRKICADIEHGDLFVRGQSGHTDTANRGRASSQDILQYGRDKLEKRQHGTDMFMLMESRGQGTQASRRQRFLLVH